MKRQPPSRSSAVGYGRPPRQHQFRPGQSGNPKGRPKGSKSAQAILREILTRKIPARLGGKVVRMSICEAIFTKIAEDALKGDPKAAGFLMNRFDMNEPENLQQAIDLGAAERHEIIDSFLQSYLKKQEKQK
jgi:hypothetical protein